MSENGDSMNHSTARNIFLRALKKVAKDASRDLWLDAEASLKYGIVDEIIYKQES